jgi:hypothetical protein
MVVAYLHESLSLKIKVGDSFKRHLEPAPEEHCLVVLVVLVNASLKFRNACARSLN